jgi:hypothetical protein
MHAVGYAGAVASPLLAWAGYGAGRKGPWLCCIVDKSIGGSCRGIYGCRYWEEMRACNEARDSGTLMPFVSAKTFCTSGTRKQWLFSLRMPKLLEGGQAREAQSNLTD